MSETVREGGVRVFRAMWAAFRDVYDEMMLLIICNLLWVLIAGPLLAIALAFFSSGVWLGAIIFGMVASVPLGLASAGLASVCYRITEGLASSWRDFFAGMRRHARMAMLASAIWMAVLIVIVVDIAFYSALSNTVGAVMTIFWLYLLVIWFAVLIYLFPLLILQDRPSLRTLGRNVLVLTLGRPVFTLFTLAIMAVIVTVTLIVPLLPVIITFALLAQWGFRATLLLIKEMEDRRAAQAEAEDNVESVKDKGRKGQIRLK
jgi:uncharacterized membrane protein YesL